MRLLKYLINDVREATDNEDTNGVSDKEIIRYFQDAVKSVQAIIFKNNPLCSYFQESYDISSPTSGRVVTLPTDVYADNAVSMVEIQSDASSDLWGSLERCWQEDQNSFVGWFTRNKSIVFTGRQDLSISYAARVWYFQRLPRWDKVWATVSGKVGQVLTLTVLDADFSAVDQKISIFTAAGVLRLANLPYVVTTPTTITITGDITSVVNGDQIVMGGNTVLEIDLPEEVEPYILTYVSKKLYVRNNYSLETSKIEIFTKEDKENIMAIFADVGQSQLRTPITDTAYLRI